MYLDVPYNHDEAVDVTGETCGREGDGTPCSGPLFDRVSRSGLTVSTICEGHAAELEQRLDGIAERYPEINHPEFCDCHGCRDAW
jgi:hypothetical protein